MKIYCLIKKTNIKLKRFELISLALTAEFMGIDSEKPSFRQIPKTIKCKIEQKCL